ncbi:MAG: Type secretion system protein, partial [Pseudomonadota bacterium]|nr:Type secretion system protein [Pseudomonadota bacterium]
GRIAASRGARKLAYLHDMSRFLRAGLLALHPARRINQRFPNSLSDLSDRSEPSRKTRPDLPAFEAHSGARGHAARKQAKMGRFSHWHSRSASSPTDCQSAKRAHHPTGILPAPAEPKQERNQLEATGGSLSTLTQTQSVPRAITSFARTENSLPRAHSVIGLSN